LAKIRNLSSTTDFADEPERVRCVPTILIIFGWRLFFYANEGNEPPHVHCRNGEKECKYWLDLEDINIEEEFSYNMSQKDHREIKKIIYNHFEYIETQWNEFQGVKNE